MISLTSRVGKNLSYQIYPKVEGCCKYKLVKGQLPPGASFDTGKISGRLTSKGTFKFTIKEKCGNKCSLIHFLINVRAKKVCQECDPKACPLGHYISSTATYSSVGSRFTFQAVSTFRGNLECIFTNQLDFNLVIKNTVDRSAINTISSYNCRSNLTTLTVTKIVTIDPLPVDPNITLVISISACNRLDVPITAVPV